MKQILPHQMFQADFLVMLPEVRRQEELDAAYKDESAVGNDIFFFFAEEIMPLIKSNDWVYDAAKRFAAEFADEYFIMLRRTRSVEDAQAQLTNLRKDVTDFLKAVIQIGLAPSSIKVAKPSDITKVVEVEKLPTTMKKEMARLLDRAADLERFYVDVGLQGIRTSFEKGLPRIFYVAKRALKVRMNKKPKPSDNELLAPHQCINWCSQQLPTRHVLHRVLVANREFYRVARNVESHEKGPTWLPETNAVYLPDRDHPMSVDVDEMAQKFRYLAYICEIGARGILAMFCEREQGAISNAVKDKYLRIYENPDLKVNMLDYPV